MLPGQIVPTRELPEASGSPTITEVVDLGGRDIKISGEVRPGEPGDGVAVIGEALWIRGTSFGRQPTVTVGGRPAQVWSRTGDGGMLVRVPVGASAGPGVVTVSQEVGTTRAPLAVRRYAAVLAGGRLTWLDASGEVPAVLGEADGGDARLLRLSPEGRAAYLVGPGGVRVFELPAQRQPHLHQRLGVNASEARAFTAGASSQLAAVVRPAEALLFDLAAPLRFALVGERPVPLPPRARRGLVRAELSPDGRFLACALAEENRLLLVDRQRLGAGDAADTAILGDLMLARETRAPVLVDLGFAHDGRTLWVLAGDTPASKPFGPQATQVFAVRVDPELRSGALALARAVTVEAAAEPARLSTGRTLPLASGAAVRLPPEKATVYFTAAARGATRAAVFSIGAEDRATQIAAVEGARPGGLDVSPDGRRLLAVASEGNRTHVLSAPADGRAGVVRTLTLNGGGATELPEVRIQP